MVGEPTAAIFSSLLLMHLPIQRASCRSSVHNNVRKKRKKERKKERKEEREEKQMHPQTQRDTTRAVNQIFALAEICVHLL